MNSVLWVCACEDVFCIQKNFYKNFSIHPNISPVSFGRYTGREKGAKALAFGTGGGELVWGNLLLRMK
jgi:hypothetical protein